MTDVPSTAIDSLAAKIADLELTDDESMVLDTVLRAAEGASGVEGFRLKPSEPFSFGLPDLRGRIAQVVNPEPYAGARDDPRSVVINHEEL